MAGEMAKEGERYKFVFGVNGTRGDFQPYLALALKLKARGHRVKMFTSVCHCKVAALFNIDAEITGGDLEEQLRGEHARRAMEQGDFALMAKPDEAKEEDLDENGEKKPELIDGQTWDELNEKARKSYLEFNPDLYITNRLGDIRDIVSSGPEIPELDIALQIQGGLPSNSWKHLMWARKLPDPDTPNICTHAWMSQQMARGEHEMWQQARFHGADDVLDKLPLPEESLADMFDPQGSIKPKILAYSPAAFPSPDDWGVLPKNWIIPGNLKITKEDQDAEAKKGNTFFVSGGSHEACSDFLAAGKKPVYIGWGSMVVYGSKHMSKLAVGALKASGQRGIIVSGWAQLSAADLDEEAELRDYAKENVLFVKAAPHEWLFPQCAACVHHGGVGTTQVSLSAGAPTIITPVFADQEANAAILVKSGAVLVTSKLGNLKTPELAETLKRICSEPSFTEKALGLKGAMEKEDGLTLSVAFIERFVRDDVKNGTYMQDLKDRKATFRKEREKNEKKSSDQFMSIMNSKIGRYNKDFAEYNRDNMMFGATCKDLIDAQKLYCISASSCLARTGEDTKSPEAGRFRMDCFVKVVEKNKKGNRFKVQKVKGYGPDEGWISTSVSGTDMCFRIEGIEMLQMVMMNKMNRIFSDLM